MPFHCSAVWKRSALRVDSERCDNRGGHKSKYWLMKKMHKWKIRLPPADYFDGQITVPRRTAVDFPIPFGCYGNLRELLTSWCLENCPSIRWNLLIDKIVCDKTQYHGFKFWKHEKNKCFNTLYLNFMKRGDFMTSMESCCYVGRCLLPVMWCYLMSVFQSDLWSIL